VDLNIIGPHTLSWSSQGQFCRHVHPSLIFSFILFVPLLLFCHTS
jgi:hypothetical protein